MKKIIAALFVLCAGGSVLADQVSSPSFGFIEMTGMTGGGTFTGGVGWAVVNQVADDITPAVNGGNVLVTSAANTGATVVTDLDSPIVGQVIWVVGAGGANPTTIADTGNFNLEGLWTATTDSVLELFVQADNDYVETNRHLGERWFDGNVNLASTLTGANAETIANSVDGQWILTGVGGSNNEALAISLEAAANTVQLSSSSGVTNLDTGALAVSATGLDAGDAAITNVSDIALDSISPDGSDISATIGAGQFAVGDGTYSPTYAAGVFIEPLTEIDGELWVDNGIYVGGAGGAGATILLTAPSGSLVVRNTTNGSDRSVVASSFVSRSGGHYMMNGETINNTVDGIVQLIGTSGTNNEQLGFDLESVADSVGLSSTTGVTTLDTNAIALNVDSSIALGPAGGGAANVLMTAASGNINLRNVANTVYEDLRLDTLTVEGKVQFGTGWEKIENTSDGVLTMTGSGQTYNEALSFNLEQDNAVLLSSSTGVVTLDTGALAVNATGLDAGDSAVTNVSDIAVDSISPDGTNVSVTIGAAALEIGDGTYSWDHTPSVGIEGALEVDQHSYFDGALNVGGRLSLENAEFIENDSNGTITLGGTVGSNNEDLDINFEVADAIQLSSSTGVVTLDTGLLAVSATGLDAGDASITNVSSIDLDSIVPDATNISVTIGAGELGIGDGTYSFGHSPNVGIEGILEVDGATYLDGGVTMASMTLSGDLTLQNGETIGNATNQKITFAANDGVAEDFTIDLGGLANTAVVTSSTGVDLIDTGVIGIDVASIIVDTFTYHIDIPVGSALWGPVAPSRVEQDDLDYLQVDPGDEINGRFEVTDAWDAVSDIELEVYVATVTGDTIDDGETIIVDCDYRVIDWGAGTTEGGNAAKVAIQGTYTQSGAGTAKSTHKVSLLFDYDHANHPISAGDDIIMRCTDGGGTYSSSPLWSKLEAELQVTTLPNH